jgi:hypothetical protein
MRQVEQAEARVPWYGPRRGGHPAAVVAEHLPGMIGADVAEGLR